MQYLKDIKIMEFEKNKLQWLEFDILEEYSHLVGGVFLRHGGTSQGAFATLNLSDAVGDHPDCVKVNRSLMQKEVGVEHIVFAKQRHENKIVLVTSNNMSKLPEADGLVTKEKNLALAITHADCQGAIFYDPENEIIGVAHAGWKGLVLDIYGAMVDFLTRSGSKAENLKVCISPSLGPDHAEFKNYKTEFPKSFWSFESDKPHYFNLWEIARAKLRDAGVRDENMEISEICTYCNPKDYFSYRREKITGRNATIIAIKK
jgi:polyphenol oxidase